MTQKRALPFYLILSLIFLTMLVKFYALGIRPPHHDEAVNGWFVDGVLKKGFYHYDPQNYHGPIYFYLIALSELIFGRSIESIRYVTVLFGALLTFLPFLFLRWIGEKAAMIASLLFAFSPAVFFYSRYAIHEIPFAFFTGLFFYFWLRAREEKFSIKILAGLGFSLGMIACLKENFVIFLGSLFIAEFMVRVYRKEFVFPAKFARYSFMGLIAFAIIALVYSAAGFDPIGIPNFFQAFNLWAKTGSAGNGHQKDWYYWLSIFKTYEWATLFGLALSPIVLFKRFSQPIRLMAVAGVGTLMAYTIVKYKTPWCLLSFQWAFLIFAGIMLAEIWEKKRFISAALVAVFVAHGAYHAYDLSYARVDQENSFYIYGQTYQEFMAPIHEIQKRIDQDPSLKKSLRIQIISTYTWPLPFVLGELESVGYFTEENAPAKLDGDYVMIDVALEPKYISRLAASYERTEHRVRQWASSMAFYRKIP